MEREARAPPPRANARAQKRRRSGSRRHNSRLRFRKKRTDSAAREHTAGEPRHSDHSNGCFFRSLARSLRSPRRGSEKREETNVEQRNVLRSKDGTIRKLSIRPSAIEILNFYPSEVISRKVSPDIFHYELHDLSTDLPTVSGTVPFSRYARHRSDASNVRTFRLVFRATTKRRIGTKVPCTREDARRIHERKESLVSDRSRGGSHQRLGESTKFERPVAFRNRSSLALSRFQVEETPVNAAGMNERF